MQIRYFPMVSDYRTVGAGATKKAPTDHRRKPIWLTAGSLWAPWLWQDEDKE